VVVTYASLPVTIAPGPGNEHESRRLLPRLRNIRIKGTRRPRSKPKCVYADNKYHTLLVIMMYLGCRGIIAARRERVNRKRRRPDRPRLFDYGTYSNIRSRVERFFAWMKSFRRIQTRYDRWTSTTYLGFLQLVCVMILMRKVSR
jgi:transposase